jgi:hypothetical protein
MSSWSCRFIALRRHQSLKWQLYRPSVIVKGLVKGAHFQATIPGNSLYPSGIDLSDNANRIERHRHHEAYPFFSLIPFVIAGPVVEEIHLSLGLFVY